jgi:hypothetical protein
MNNIDQRGFARTFAADTTCDIGAVEANSSPTAAHVSAFQVTSIQRHGYRTRLVFSWRVGIAHGIAGFGAVCRSATAYLASDPHSREPLVQVRDENMDSRERLLTAHRPERRTGRGGPGTLNTAHGRGTEDRYDSTEDSCRRQDVCRPQTVTRRPQLPATPSRFFPGASPSEPGNDLVTIALVRYLRQDMFAGGRHQDNATAIDTILFADLARGHGRGTGRVAR